MGDSVLPETTIHQWTQFRHAAFCLYYRKPTTHACMVNTECLHPFCVVSQSAFRGYETFTSVSNEEMKIKIVS